MAAAKPDSTSLATSTFVPTLVQLSLITTATMATSSASDNYAIDQFASRTCVPCKSSKKKCDKTLPTCNRCSRLCLSCTYDSVAELGANNSMVKFRAIFDRLERLESRVFASEAEQPTRAPNRSTHPKAGTNDDNQSDWQLKPNLLQPSYLELIAAINLSRILDERRTSVRVVCEKYLDLIHDYMPLISREKLESRIQECENLEPHGAFLIFVSCILLLTEEPADSLMASSAASPPELYRVCKYNHSLFVSFKEPCIELIQSGVLIAQYEHAQCMGDQAYLTIGACARMAGAIGLYSATSDISPTTDTVNGSWEKLTVLFVIYILDRHIKIASKVMMKPMIYDHISVMKPSAVAVNNFGPLTLEADACDILDRLQTALYIGNTADMPNLRSDARVNQVLALEAELQSLMVKFSDHRDDSLWQRAIATTFAAKLCIHAYYRLETAGSSAVESPEQRRKTSLESLGLLMDISSDQLNMQTSTTATFPSPFAIVVVFLMLDAMKSLDAAGSDTYLLREQQTLIDMLQRSSRRWRLAGRLSESLKQA